MLAAFASAADAGADAGAAAGCAGFCSAIGSSTPAFFRISYRRKCEARQFMGGLSTTQTIVSAVFLINDKIMNSVFDIPDSAVLIKMQSRVIIIAMGNL